MGQDFVGACPWGVESKEGVARSAFPLLAHLRGLKAAKQAGNTPSGLRAKFCPPLRQGRSILGA